MSATFDMRRIVDVIAKERTRAANAARVEQEALAKGDQAAADTASVARYWHQRTVDLLHEAIPAARNWRGQ